MDKIKPVRKTGLTETLEIPSKITQKPSKPMKTIIAAIISLAIGTTFIHAQGGLLSWQDATAHPSTNSTYYAPGYPSTTGATSGFTSGSGAGLYYFILLEATSTTSVDSGNPFGPDWNVVTYQTGGIAYGTNNIIAGSVMGLGLSGGFASDLNPGISYDDMVVGWSGSLGTSWSQIEAQAETFSFSASGYLGYSNVGTIIPTSAPAPPAGIIGGSSAQPGQIVLYQIEPEPATLSLFGLGGLSILLLRRRNAIP
jgi:hypothetical protein